MAVKVIKHGKSHYTTTCPRCGCEFEYDLKDLGFGNGINCPDCDYYCYHPMPGKIVNPGWPWDPIPTVPNIPDPYVPNWPKNPITDPWVTWKDPCEGCWYNEQLKKGKAPIVGDSPCTWCSKRQPNVIYTNATENKFTFPKDWYSASGADIKVTLDDNDQKFDFNKLHVYTSYANVNPPKEEKKLDLEFSPEDIDLPQ